MHWNQSLLLALGKTRSLLLEPHSPILNKAWTVAHKSLGTAAAPDSTHHYYIRPSLSSHYPSSQNSHRRSWARKPSVRSSSSQRFFPLLRVRVSPLALALSQLVDAPISPSPTRTEKARDHEDQHAWKEPFLPSSIQSCLIDRKWPYFRSLTTYNEQVSNLPRLNVGIKSKNRPSPSKKEKKVNLTAPWEITHYY